jgi:hypothetical protein
MNGSAALFWPYMEFQRVDHSVTFCMSRRRALDRNGLI